MLGHGALVVTPPRSRLFAALAALALVPVALVACGSGGGSATASATGTLQVVDVRIDRPALPSQAAVRLVVRNGTARADTLTSVSGSVASGVSVHRSTLDAKGRSTMVPVSRLPIPARSDVTFEPGGLHVMLEGLKHDLAVGDRVRLTFTFTHAGTRTVTATVVLPGADDQEHDHG